MEFKKKDFEFQRWQAKSKFDQIREQWIEAGTWCAPDRIMWMQSQMPIASRLNRHIVDGTHLLARRSYVAGFLEGNTSANRPWFRHASNDPNANEVPENRKWLQEFTNACHRHLLRSNFYNAAQHFYDDFGTFNNATYYVEEIDGGLFWHVLEPGSYYLINNGLGEAVVLVREFSLSVKALVSSYVKKKNGNWDWSNVSDSVKEMWDKSDYTTMVDVVCIIQENENFDPYQPQITSNRKWVSVTYEQGIRGNSGAHPGNGNFGSAYNGDLKSEERWLNISFSKRKPFIAGRANGGTAEWSMKGPTNDALGLIKSLNKKAVGKDQALEKMLAPALQGPANLRKSYITNAANGYVPLDANSLAQTKGQGLRSIFEVNPAIGTLIQDVSDLRQQVEQFYYADYLMYLSRNPKTRTAAETNAVVNEQQVVIGPNLQSLNWTHNLPVVDLISDWVLDNDPFLAEIPEGLSGRFVQTEFVSVFAQAQKAADLPAIRSYLMDMSQIAASSPQAAKLWDKVNLDKFADLIADRLFLPEGLNNPQGKVDAQREQQAQMQQRQMQMEQMVQASQAAKNVGIQAPGAEQAV